MYKIWNKEKLGTEIAIDTETTVTDFTVTSDIVTFQCYDGESAYYVEISDICEFFKVNTESIFIFHNCAFDIDVIAKAVGERQFFHSFLEKDQLRDTMLLYKLVKLAENGFVPMKASLDLVSQELLSRALDKNEGIRMDFGRFKDVSIPEIPENYLKYGIEDAIATYDIYQVIKKNPYFRQSKTRLSEQIQIAGSIALNRVYKNGIGFDLDGAKVKLTEINSTLNILQDHLAMYGWVRGVKGSKERFDEIIKFHNLDLPKTDSGNCSTKEEDLRKYRDVHFIDTYLNFIELEKLSTFIREVQSERLHPRYNSLVNTGRTSCAKPNFQQLPRQGGIRELFVAKSGHTLIITDYSTLELCTLAQVTYDMYGKSVMRDKINKGDDLHKYYASILLKKPIEEVTKDDRQKAKAANFGFPGGLGVDSFRTYAKNSYGVTLSEDEARDMRRAWLCAFPEMDNYLKGEVGYAETKTGRIRGDTTYCAEKNTPFQGLAADGAKIALYYLDNAGYTIVGFVHDEIILEVPEDRADSILLEQERIMIEAMQTVVPDVRISVESQITRRYCK